MPDGPAGRYPGPYQPQQPPILPDYAYGAPPNLDNEADGWDAVRKVWRRKWLVAGVTAGFLLVGGLAAASMTPRFQAEARVLLGVQDPNVANIQSVLENIIPNSSTVRSEAYVIESREMARQVGYRLALDKSPMFNPELRPEPGLLDKLSPGYLKSQVADLIGQALVFFGLSEPESEPAGPYAGMSPEERQKAKEENLWTSIESALLYRLTVEPLNRSNVLSVEAESTDPEMAAKIANTFSKLYVEQQLSKRRQATEKANDWLQSRIDELRVEVRESERAVEKYRQEHDLFATKSDTIIGQQLAALNQELTRSENQLSEAQSKLAQAEGSSGEDDSLPSVLQSPLIVQLRGQQAELERQAADLAASYTSKHPKMRNIQAQLADTRNKIDAEIQRIVGSLRNEVRIARNQRERVQQRMADLKAQMGESNTEMVKLRQLEREAEANRNMLTSLLERSKETTQHSELLTASAEVLSRATPPSSPAFPPTNLILLLAGFVGIGAGVLLALLIEKLDQTFRTSDEIEEYTGLPTLAVIPTIRRRAGARLDHVIRNPHSVYTNSLRMLSTFLSRDRDARSLSGLVVFTSAVAGEGKSHTSCSLAQLLASEGRRAILLDFDWRQPSQHRLFGQSRRAGIIDLLCGNSRPEDVVYHDEASGTDVLFAGDVKLLRGHTVPMERLQLLLHTLSQHYDVIILDTSPTMLTPEVLYLSQIADHVVMNVKWGSTTRRAVTTEIKNILRSGGRVSGVVLNQVDLERYNKYSYSDGGYLRQGYLVHNA